MTTGVQIDRELAHTLPGDCAFKREALWFQFAPSSTRRHRCFLGRCFWLALHRQQAAVGPDSIPNANPAARQRPPRASAAPGGVCRHRSNIPARHMLLLSKELRPRLLTQELQQVVFPQLISSRGPHPWRRWKKTKEEASPLGPLEELLPFMPIVDGCPPE